MILIRGYNLKMQIKNEIIINSYTLNHTLKGVEAGSLLAYT